jgi:LysR family transcriptional regulator, nitrogen assimilation regulatory protein
VDIRQLHYFVSVLEARSVNKAAALLRIGQPALTIHIQHLEQELGVQLLNRHARGVTPTEAGQRLARHAGQLLRQVDHIRRDLSVYANEPRGCVLLCTARSIPHTVTTALTARCQTTLPDVKLTVIEGWRQHLSHDDARADLALTFHHPEHNVPFVWEPLIQDELVLVCAANENHLSEVDLCAISQRSLFLPSKPHYIRQLIEAAALLAGVELDVSCDIDSFEVIKELTARGKGSTILPIGYVQDDIKRGRLRIARIKNTGFRRTLYILHSARQRRSSAIDLVCREARTIILEFANDGAFGWRQIVNETDSRI